MDYGELKQHFLNILNRTDCTDDLADTFMAQGISRVHRLLRVPSMERIEELAVDAEGRVAIPDDYLQLIDLYYGDRKLTKLPLGDFLEVTQETGEPRYYVRMRDKWLLKPNPGLGAKVTCYYYGDLMQLEDDNDSDPLLQIASDLMIYAALTFAADHFLDERGAAFDTRFQQIIGELQSQAEGMEFYEGTLAVQPSTDLEY